MMGVLYERWKTAVDTAEGHEAVLERGARGELGRAAEKRMNDALDEANTVELLIVDTPGGMDMVADKLRILQHHIDRDPDDIPETNRRLIESALADIETFMARNPGSSLAVVA